MLSWWQQSFHKFYPELSLPTEHLDTKPFPNIRHWLPFGAVTMRSLMGKQERQTKRYKQANRPTNQTTESSLLTCSLSSRAMRSTIWFPSSEVAAM